jgi:site-specific recombinase XerD
MTPTPKTMTKGEVDRLLSACNPSARLDASGFLKALLEEQRRTGKRISEIVTAPTVHAEIIKLCGQLQIEADKM